MRRKAFTLIELIVCIVIIAILFAITVPNLGHAIESADRLNSKIKLRNQAIFQTTYANDSKEQFLSLRGNLPTSTPIHYSDRSLQDTMLKYDNQWNKESMTLTGDSVWAQDATRLWASFSDFFVSGYQHTPSFSSFDKQSNANINYENGLLERSLSTKQNLFPTTLNYHDTSVSLVIELARDNGYYQHINPTTGSSGVPWSYKESDQGLTVELNYATMACDVQTASASDGERQIVHTDKKGRKYGLYWEE